MYHIDDTYVLKRLLHTYTLTYIYDIDHYIHALLLTYNRLLHKYVMQIACKPRYLYILPSHVYIYILIYACIGYQIITREHYFLHAL